MVTFRKVSRVVLSHFPLFFPCRDLMQRPPLFLSIRRSVSAPHSRFLSTPSPPSFVFTLIFSTLSSLKRTIEGNILSMYPLVFPSLCSFSPVSHPSQIFLPFIPSNSCVSLPSNDPLPLSFPPLSFSFRAIIDRYLPFSGFFASVFLIVFLHEYHDMFYRRTV